MRLIVIIAAVIFSTALNAQVPVIGFNNFAQRPFYSRGINTNDSSFNKKWFVTHYAGISTSFSFYKGGNATVVSAPVGLQLNRRLNDNLYAFAGIAVAPAYINFNQTTFLNTNVNKHSFNQNALGLYSRVEAGLTYVNDAKTFSISGSISVERNNYPVYQYYQPNTPSHSKTISPDR